MKGLDDLRTKLERMRKLTERAAQLEKAMERAEARQKHQDRKARTRRLILMGTVVESMISDGKIDAGLFEKWARKYLNERDAGVLFGVTDAPVDKP